MTINSDPSYDYRPAEDLRIAAAREYPELRPVRGPAPYTSAHLDYDPADPESMRRIIEAQQAALAQQLTPEEVAELRELRAMRVEQTRRDLAAAAEAAARLSPPSHYVHLADGEIVEGSQLATHHSYGDGTGRPEGDRVVAVAASYPK